jgi:glycosyltransferase involved in cell wall biosynthesis
VEGVHIRGIADALKAEGIHVDIISLPGADPYSTPAAMSPTRQATPVLRLISRLPQPLFELAEVAYNLVAGFRIWRYLQRNRDVGFIYERYSLFMFSTVLIARWFHKPIYLEINDSAVVERVRPLSFKRIATWIERWVLTRADGLVFVSTRFRDRVQAGIGRLAPSIITPNAANISMFTIPAERREAARRELGCVDSIVCGYLGAFVPWHAIDQFVYAIADRLAERPELRLLLIGDGATFDAVAGFVSKAGLQERIILSGRVPHSRVPNLLAAMDVAILPNAGDYTSPVKLFEFMAGGIPPVAPDLDPIKEVLEEGRTGWLFRAHDMQAAVDTLLEKTRDPAALRRVGVAARDYVAKHRQWRNNVLQLLEFHQATIGKPA